MTLFQQILKNLAEAKEKPRERKMTSNAMVKCSACDEITNKNEWKQAEVINNKFVGGCPACKSEFYEEISEIKVL